MALIQFTTPPDGDIYYVKSDAVLSVSPPFLWNTDEAIYALTVVLATGERISVENTDENLAAARRAIDPTGGAVIVET